MSKPVEAGTRLFCPALFGRLAARLIATGLEGRTGAFGGFGGGAAAAHEACERTSVEIAEKRPSQAPLLSLACVC